MSKKKILYVHHASQYGGAPKSLGLLVNNLDLMKYESSLINIVDGPINEYFETLPTSFKVEQGIRPFHGSIGAVKSVKMFIRNWLFLFPSIIKARKILKKGKPDIVHVNESCLAAFAIAAKMENIKVIAHVRGPIREGYWGAPIRYFCKKYCNGLIAISNYDLESLQISRVDIVKRKVIYNFIEQYPETENNCTNILKKELRIANDSIIFLYAARFASYNGWKELIEFAKKITKSYSNFHFVLAGASDEHLNYINHNNIHILGFRKDVDFLLRCSDVFICPFTVPHFSRGIIEASAHGIPSLGANIGGVNELILHDKTGFLYNNEDEFIKYAEFLGSQKDDRSEMGANARQFAELNFDKSKNLKQTYDFYKEVLND